jgi:hypothetical protein
MNIYTYVSHLPNPNKSEAKPKPPPKKLFHYTTGLKVGQIIRSGHIRPATAQTAAHQKPVVWFSTSPEWDPTASKCLIPGKLGQVITAKAQSGLVRITVPANVAPHTIQDLPSIAGTTPADWMGLLLVGLELGADPGAWRFTATPVPTALFREVEFFDFANERWLAIDLAELACRN